MLVEISVAVKFILSQLYSKLPRRRVNCYGEELEKCLHKKFQAHWFPHDPQKDSAFRALHTSGPNLDPCLVEAAKATGLEWSEIKMFLPPDLVIEIDPGYVATTTHNNSPSSTPNEIAWNCVAAGSSNSSGCSSASSETSGTAAGTKQVLFSESSNPSDSSSSNLSKSLDSGAGSVFNSEETYDCLSATGVSSSANLQQPNQSLFGGKDLPTLLDSVPWKVDESFGKSSSAPNTANWAGIKSNPLNNAGRMQPEPVAAQIGLETVITSKNAPASSQINTSFTAATFAATKFGSTKLKNHSKRNKRIISPTDSQMNHSSKDQEGLNPRCDLPSSKLEMLREAIQQQQQMLNSVDFSGGQGQTGANFNPNMHMGMHSSNLPGVGRHDLWSNMPAPIGSNRSPKHSNNMHFDASGDCSSNLFTTGNGCPNNVNALSNFHGTSNSHRMNENACSSSSWQKMMPSANNNIWDNNVADEQNLLSFELSKLLSLDNNGNCHNKAGFDDLGAQIDNSQFGNNHSDCSGDNGKGNMLDFDAGFHANDLQQGGGAQGAAFDSMMGSIWSNQNANMNMNMNCGGNSNPWGTDFVNFSSPANDIFSAFDSTGLSKNNNNCLSLQNEFEPFLDFGPKNSDFTSKLVAAATNQENA